MAWVCPDCGRRFGRAVQSHECTPALSLDDYFATADERERPIFDAVLAHLDSLGDVHVEPVAVGIFLKRDRSFVELRPMTKWVALSFPFPHRIQSPRISRKPVLAGSRWYHVVNLQDSDEFDDDVRDWLTEAWHTLPA
ncbi:MAG: hypothetical protein QOG46_2684 [Pseudonocardiales bacterium]|jgi:hypothetical protein|nr:hypothetical protein [Pseudonocardiales bacterium]